MVTQCTKKKRGTFRACLLGLSVYLPLPALDGKSGLLQWDFPPRWGSEVSRRRLFFDFWAQPSGSGLKATELSIILLFRWFSFIFFFLTIECLGIQETKIQVLHKQLKSLSHCHDRWKRWLPVGSTWLLQLIKAATSSGIQNPLAYVSPLSHQNWKLQ